MYACIHIHTHATKQNRIVLFLNFNQRINNILLVNINSYILMCVYLRVNMSLYTYIKKTNIHT